MSHLISTRATPTTCARCQQQILVAIDNGIPARIDTTPLNQNAELAALLENRWTYELTPYGTLAHRDPARIAAGPPRNGGTIHADHHCPTNRHQQEGLF